jgi:hypothetical protein
MTFRQFSPSKTNKEEFVVGSKWFIWGGGIDQYVQEDNDNVARRSERDTVNTELVVDAHELILIGARLHKSHD